MPAKWTKREIAYLKRHYHKKRAGQIAEHLGRSRVAVQSAIKRFGLSRPPLRWSRAELSYLRRHYRKRPAWEIAKKLKRPLPQIYQTAARTGLAKSKPVWPAAHFDAIRRMHSDGKNDSEIAAELGADRRTICDHRQKLGLQVIGQDSATFRKKVAATTRRQCRRAGVKTLAQFRVLAFRNLARESGWPEDLRPRAIQFLNLLWSKGPMTRRQLANAAGMPWKGSRKSLVSNDPEGSYLAHLAARGLVVALKRANKVGPHQRWTNIYMIAPGVKPQKGAKR